MVTKRNIIDFPRSDDRRFSDALKAFDDGRHRESLDRAIALIDEGYAHAYTLAGILFEEGGTDVPRDLSKALFYFQKAVEDVGAVEGWLALGRIYYFGKGVQQNFEKAFHYYSVVNEDTENRIAHLMLGRMYLEGTGTAMDFNKARYHLEQALEQGAVIALAYLALLEQRCGHYLRSLCLRAKAAFAAFRIARRDPRDWRLRES